MTNHRPSRPKQSIPKHHSSSSNVDTDRQMGEVTVRRIYGFGTNAEAQEHAHKNMLKDGDYSVGHNERTGFYYEYKKQPTSDFKSLSKIVEPKGKIFIVHNSYVTKNSTKKYAVVYKDETGMSILAKTNSKTTANSKNNKFNKQYNQGKLLKEEKSAYD